MWWDSLIEEKLRAGQEKGLFNGLAGEGKPLRQDDGDGKDWLVNHLLHEAGVLPEWLQLRKDIEAERPAVVAALREYRERAAELDRFHPGDQAVLRRLEERYVRLARKINLLIDAHNLRCPSLKHELTRFREDAIERGRRAGRHP